MLTGVRASVCVYVRACVCMCVRVCVCECASFLWDVNVYMGGIDDQCVAGIHLFFEGEGFQRESGNLDQKDM